MSAVLPSFCPALCYVSTCDRQVLSPAAPGASARSTTRTRCDCVSVPCVLAEPFASFGLGAEGRPAAAPRLSASSGWSPPLRRLRGFRCLVEPVRRLVGETSVCIEGVALGLPARLGALQRFQHGCGIAERSSMAKQVLTFARLLYPSLYPLGNITQL